MKIVIEGTKEEIEAIMAKIAQPAQFTQPIIIQPAQSPNQTAIPWWWGQYEVTC